MTELFINEKARVADLTPNVKNPRKIKAEAKRQLLDRLVQYGMIGVPVRNADGTLLSGHQRCALLAQNGFGDVVIDVRTAIRQLTERECKEVMLIENGHAGEYDFALLRAEFDQVLNLADFGIDLGAMDQELKELMSDADAPELAIVAKMSERYATFVIVCRNEIDENHIAEKLGVDRQACYKSTRIGTTHVVDAKTFIEKW